MSLPRVAIVGPGLLGGSIALAVRARGLGSVAIWARRAEAAEAALRDGFAEVASTELREVVEGADVVVLCTPVGAMPALAREIAPLVKADALITDVGSVKAALVAEIAPIFRGRFVGSHPMAGSEQTGMQAARAGLFEGAVCIVTPEAASLPETVAAVGEFWTSLGCRVRQLSPVEHDEVVALISHLPHLLAATLVNTVADRNAAAFGYAGPGFRDTTRVAGGAPEMWAEILTANRESVLKSADAMIESLREIANILARDAGAPALLEFLTLAKHRRDAAAHLNA